MKIYTISLLEKILFVTSIQKITALKKNVFRSLSQSATPFVSNLWRDAKTVKKFNSLPNPIEITFSKSQKGLFVEKYFVFEIEA